jgi:hypothetical protein
VRRDEDAERLEGQGLRTVRYGCLIAGARTMTARIERETGLPSRAVAEVIGKALTADGPRTRYVVGNEAKVRAQLDRFLPDRVMDRLIGRAFGG